MKERTANTITGFYNVFFHHKISSLHTTYGQCITNEQMHIGCPCGKAHMS